MTTEGAISCSSAPGTPGADEARPESVAAGSTELTTAKFWLGVLALAVVSTTVWLAAIARVPGLVPGWTTVTVVSGSMSPSIRPGDIVVAAPGPETIAPGTVVVFDDPAGDGYVTHRVVEVLDDGTYRTKGDANAVADSTPLHREDIVGVGTILVPLVGMPARWLQTDQMAAFALWLAITLAAAWCARWGVSRRFDPWRAAPTPGAPA